MSTWTGRCMPFLVGFLLPHVYAQLGIGADGLAVPEHSSHGTIESSATMFRSSQTGARTLISTSCNATSRSRCTSRDHGGSVIAVSATGREGVATNEAVVASTAQVPQARASHTFLFVGGLQRSGTTWLEKLVGSPQLSSLSFENADPTEYESRQPWLWQNHSQAYFEMAVRSGGVEGKFVQGVYPYKYLVHDVGKAGLSLDAILKKQFSVSSHEADQLFSQWSLFWNTSRAVLMEKTPENFLMGPYLQTVFGTPNTKFVFIMRHPLVWALAIEKWIGSDYVALRTVEDRVAFWFDCMSRMAEQLPQLKDVIVIQLETASISPSIQLSVAKHLLCDSRRERYSSRENHLSLNNELWGENSAIIMTSLGYVTCWLAGMEFKSSLRRCVDRNRFRDPVYSQNPQILASENAWRLAQIASQSEMQARQFGYSFQTFIKLSRLPHQQLLQQRIGGRSPSERAMQVGVVLKHTMLRGNLRPVLVIPPSKEPRTTFAPHRALDHVYGHVMVVFHKMGCDRDQPSGMDVRLMHVVQTLVSLHYVVHFVSHESVHDSQLPPFDFNVVIYTGAMQRQFEEAHAAASIQSILIFFTTLTMAVHQRMTAGDQLWHEEPSGRLPEEQVVAWVKAMPRFDPCIVAVADDVHYLRSAEVMSHYDAQKARLASMWIRRRELSFYASVDGVATISLEDAAILQASLRGQDRAQISSKCSTRCGCIIGWLPYVQHAKAYVAPFDKRHDGMLYVGGMHGISVRALQWLLQSVQPLVASSFSGSSSILNLTNKGHLHLAGPGWSEHMNEISILKRAVEAGYVSILGTLTEEQLERRLQQHKVFVAPVFNGTGIATKNVLAMANGIPLITTLNGLHGLGLPPDQHTVTATNDPADFAARVLQVQSSAEMFNTFASAGLKHVGDHLSQPSLQAALCKFITCSFEHSSRDHAVTRPQTHQICTTRRSALIRVAQESISAQSFAKSRPLVLLGWMGSRVAELARLLQYPGLCLAVDPLNALRRANAISQYEHLHGLLSDAAYCQATLGATTAPLVQGFALEITRDIATLAIFSRTAGGIDLFFRLLARSKVIVVQRCNKVAWAAERLFAEHRYLPDHSCVDKSCNTSNSIRRSLGALQMRALLHVGDGLDHALQSLVDSVAEEWFPFYVEWLSGSHSRTSAVLGRFKEFIGILSTPTSNLTINVGNERSITIDWQEVDPLRNNTAEEACSEGCVPLQASCKFGSRPCHDAAINMLLSVAFERPPIVVFAVHGEEGGSLLVGKMVSQACNTSLWAASTCMVRDGFDGCDPENVDICLQQSGRFSAGRYAQRGYRFVHVVRSPLHVLTHSFLRYEPNATHRMNATVLASSLEARWRNLSDGTLREMKMLQESHASDIHAMTVKLEDLLLTTRRNSTLERVMAFVSTRKASLQSSDDIPMGQLFRVLSTSSQMEQKDELKRKQLERMILRKPRKCQHLNKLMRALHYEDVPCREEAQAQPSKVGRSLRQTTQSTTQP